VIDCKNPKNADSPIPPPSNLIAKNKKENLIPPTLLLPLLQSRDFFFHFSKVATSSSIEPKRILFKIYLFTFDPNAMSQAKITLFPCGALTSATDFEL